MNTYISWCAFSYLRIFVCSRVRVFSGGAQDILYSVVYKRIFNYILDNVVYSQVYLQYIYAIYCKYTLNISENIKYRYTFYGPQRIYSLNIVKYLLSLRNILYSKECTKEYAKNAPLITNPHFDNNPPWSRWQRRVVLAVREGGDISEYSRIWFYNLIDGTDQMSSKYLTRFGRFRENIQIKMWAPPARFSGLGQAGGVR